MCILGYIYQFFIYVIILEIDAILEIDVILEIDAILEIDKIVKRIVALINKLPYL